MKQGTTFFENQGHKWIAIARDPDRPEHFIDTIEYLIINEDKGMLLDPGGIEIFPDVFSVVGKEIETLNIESILASHEDPDIISSLSLWLTFNPSIRCYCSWVWGGFIPHYGCQKDDLILVPDEGMEVNLGSNLTLNLVPAHHLHASGNFHLHDPQAQILFTGDVGAALFPEESPIPPLFVENFDNHTSYMKTFHERWMPSNQAKADWIERVSHLDIEYLCPQHGSIFKGDDVKRFLDWFDKLEVGKRYHQIGKSGE